MVKKFFLFISFVLLPFSSQAANITVEVDRDPVSIDESFMIYFFADDRISDTPDFSPLQQDFEILNRTHSSSMKYSNGNLRKKTRWNLRVMAKRSGKLTIPSIAIGDDMSPSSSITVNESTSSSHSDATENSQMFIEVEATPNTAYVQQQIIYSVRFFRAVNIHAASMSDPSISGAEVVIEKLGDDSNYETYRNGRRYIVIERKYALFPQQSGDITIEPITLDVQVATSARGVFDPFAQNSTTTRLNSNSISLKVDPIPANMHGHTWLPASELKLTESWSKKPPEFIVGEPITRTLTLKAEGLTAAQLPSLTMADTQAFKAYPDQPRLNDKRGSRGISGTRQEKIALVPTQAGQLSLPEIQISWWNINSNKLETITLPARNVQVKPSPNNQVTIPPATIVQSESIDIIPDSTPTTATETINVAKQENNLYIKLSIFLALGWLTTVIAWLISKRSQKHVQNVDDSTKNITTKTSSKAVKKACLSNDPQLSKTQLLNWAKDHWQNNPPSNIGEIGIRLNQAALQQEIEKLNQALYGAAGDKSWQGNDLWQQLSSALKIAVKTDDKKKDDVLVPLYP